MRCCLHLLTFLCVTFSLCLFSGCYDEGPPQSTFTHQEENPRSDVPPAETSRSQSPNTVTHSTLSESTALDEAPTLTETHSSRTTEAEHSSGSFNTSDVNQAGAHAELTQSTEEVSPASLSADEIARRVVERLREDPEFGFIAHDLSQDPANTSLQQMALDYFLRAEPAVFESAVNIFAYIGGTASALLLNGLFFKACRSNDPLLAPRHAIWLLGLIVESVYVLRLTLTSASFEPWYTHLGLGVFMGSAIIAQCSLVKRLTLFGNKRLISTCKKAP